MANILVDSDIILDFLLKREPFAVHARDLMQRIERKQVTGWITPVHVANLHYLLQRSMSREFAMQSLAGLLQLMEVLPMNKAMVLRAMQNGFSDFEDALHYEAALASAVPIIAVITRNTKDYRSGEISVLTAKEFLSC